MVNSLSSYRVYTSTLSPIENLPYATLDQEMHIVLAFARDYSGATNTKGTFEAFFDKTTLTADAINAIKNKANLTTVKFFLSIGGRKQDFPFALDPNEEATWVNNAVTSLKKIVAHFGLDGIDVYYENIKPNAESLFANAIFKVISTLKNKDKVISQASITVSGRLKNTYYELFRKNEKLFDYVVYQTHNETSRISEFQGLESILNGLPFPKERTLAGHSDARDDWAIVPPPIFLGVVPQILDQDYFGLSQWIVTGADPNPEA